MEKEQMKPYAMSVKKAAIYIGKSPNFIRKLIHEKKLKAKKKTTITIGRNDFIIKTVDLEIWVDTNN